MDKNILNKEIEETAKVLKKEIGERLNSVNSMVDLKDIFKEIGKVKNIEWASKYKNIWNGFKNYHFYYDPDTKKRENIFDGMKIPERLKSDYYEVQKSGYEKIFNFEPNLMMLFLCMAWKNGDLDKEKHIVEGIIVKEEEHNKDENDCYGYPVINSEGPVFYQFGLFLQTMSKRNEKEKYSTVEPIIDQHSLRAYNFFFDKENDLENAEVELNSKTKIRTNICLVRNYKKWHKETMERLNGEEDAFLLLNQIMFILGKMIKLS